MQGSPPEGIFEQSCLPGKGVVEVERERDKSGSKHHFAGTLNLCWNYGEAIDRMVKNGLKCCFSCRSFVM